MTLHLYIINRCTHNCPLCCNKQYSIDEIPVVTVEDLRSVDTICLTGGEPLLYGGIIDFAKKIKNQYRNVKYIYVYTSGDTLLRFFNRRPPYFGLLRYLDGVSIAPKTKNDIQCIDTVFGLPPYWNVVSALSSNRIYVFPEQEKEMRKILDGVKDLENFHVIKREWKKDFNPADDSIFRRLPILFD